MPPKADEKPSSEKQPPQQIFYERPEALNTNVHAGLRLQDGGDFSFARQTNSVPIAATEFAQAMRSYPIVFGPQVPFALAVLGLESENLFVGKNGSWRTGEYIPAFIRRYPFVFIAQPGGKMALGIDRASARIAPVGDVGRPLFEDAKPTALTQEAMQFCGALEADQAITMTFGRALEEHALLVENQAQGTFPDGRPFRLQGFRVVDRAAFTALPDAVIIDWHRKGWVALINYHLASLDRMASLLMLPIAEANETI